MKKILTIAGSDCSGGAGIQADIKTITMHGHYAMSVITSLTAQNTIGVTGIHDVPPEFVKKQLNAVFTDIYPDAVKIGMVSNAEIIHVIAETLKEYGAENIVLDPVMISTSGHRLLEPEAEGIMVKELFPLADLITPNIPEAEFLCDLKIKNTESMAKAANGLADKFKTNILIKGGHLEDNSDDILKEYNNNNFTVFESAKINSDNTHGTGCTLSSAIACHLAEGLSLTESVRNAKEYVSDAIKAGLDLGQGNGPINHFYRLK